MSTTVGQHAVATFTSPVNGTSPIDANTVRGNDNTIRVAYVDHDADPGIHVQSSTLASRPVAGVAGRKWITADTGSYKLWYDDGTRWHEIGNDAVDIAVVADETLAKGDVVSVTGFNTGLNMPRVAKFTGAASAFGIAPEAIANGAQGYVINTGLINDIDTNAFGATGTILYPAATGTFTSTKPTSGTYQTAAYVLRQASSGGALYVEFSAPRIVEASANTASTVVLRDASGNFSAGTITANLTGNISGTAPAGTLTGTTLASNVVNSSLTSVGTLTNLTVTNTISGSINGNAATATALQTSRNINGVAFNGTADITVAAAAGTLTGNTLASGVTASSLTSVGTLTNLTVTNPISGSLSGTATNANNLTGTTNEIRSVSYTFPASQGGASTVLTNDGAGNLSWASGGAAAAGTLTGTTLASNVVNSSLTSVGTLTSLTVSGNLTVDTNTLAVVASTNRVGILNASPGSTLHVGSTLASGGLADSTFALNVSSPSNTYFAVQDAAVQCYFGAIGTFATPEMRIGTYTNHPLRMIVNNSQLWSFLSGGSFVCTAATGNARIGIGNALPDYQLHIGSGITPPLTGLGQVMITNAGNTGLNMTDGTIQGYMFTASGFGLIAGSYTAHDFVLRTNNTARWSIGATTGHLLAGTDNTYDIGASGATRPRDLYLGRNMVGSGWVRAGAVSAGAASTTTFGSTTSTSVGATGAASALPANPLGYLVAHVGTTEVRIPYYNA